MATSYVLSIKTLDSSHKSTFFHQKKDMFPHQRLLLVWEFPPNHRSKYFHLHFVPSHSQIIYLGYFEYNRIPFRIITTPEEYAHSLFVLKPLCMKYAPPRLRLYLIVKRWL